MISNAVIDQIRSGVDIVGLVSEFVDLKSTGANLFGRCPFPDHEDSSPSFSVSPSKQIFKCFGCGRGGNVFTFLMELESMTFVEAVISLGERIGVSIDRTVEDDRSELRACLTEIENIYHEYLMSHNDLLTYFTDVRGFSIGTVRDFKLGYGIPVFQKLKEKFSIDVINSTGVVESKGAGAREPLIGRYITPLRERGKAVAFSGRSTNPSDLAKYLNSKESAVYYKSRFLLGLDTAASKIKKTNSVIVVEGNFDCISMQEAGFENTVALCGGALTLAHVKSLLRTHKTVNVVLMLDGDDAGKRAMTRAIPILFSNGVMAENLWLVDLNPGDDPDSICHKHGVTGVESALLKSKPMIEWVTAGGKDPKTRESVLSGVKKIAELISDTERRLMFIDLCSSQLEVRSLLITPLVKTVSKKLEVDEFTLVLAGFISDRVSDEYEPERWEGISVDESLNDFIFHIQKWNGIEASLFDGLTADQAKQMSKALTVSKSGVTLEYVLNLMKGNKVKRMVDSLLIEIRQAEREGRDCSGFRVCLDNLLRRFDG